MAYPDMSYGGAPAAAGLLGQPRRYQPNATRAQVQHVKVPISTLVSLLLAEAPKPVMPRARSVTPGSPMQTPPPAAMSQLGMQRPAQQSPLPTVGSLSALFGQRRRPTLGRYQNF